MLLIPMYFIVFIIAYNLSGRVAKFLGAPVHYLLHNAIENDQNVLVKALCFLPIDLDRVYNGRTLRQHAIVNGNNHIAEKLFATKHNTPCCVICELDDIKPLTQLLINPGCEIKKLHIRSRHINDTYLAVIAEAIKSPHCNVEELYLLDIDSYNDAKIIIDAVVERNSIKILSLYSDMSNNEMKDCISLIGNQTTGIEEFKIPFWNGYIGRSDVIAHSEKFTKTNDNLFLFLHARNHKKDYTKASITKLPIEMLRLVKEMTGNGTEQRCKFTIG